MSTGSHCFSWLRMKLIKLTLSNIFRYTSLELDLSNLSFALIAGPNGAGKSSIVESIFLALTGRTTDGRTLNQVVNRFNADGAASITLMLEAEGSLYTISRVKSSKSWSLDVRQNDVRWEGANVRDIQSKLEQFIGDYRILLRSIFFPQQAVDVLAGLTPAVRRAEFSKFIGLDRFESWLNVVKSDRQKLEEKLRSATADLHHLRGRLSEKTVHFNERTHLFLVEALKQSQQELAEARKNLAPIEQKVHSLKHEIFALERDLRLIEGLGQTCPTCRQDIGDEHRKRIIDRLTNKISELRSDLKPAEAELAEATTEITALERVVQKNKERLAVSEHEKELFERAAHDRLAIEAEIQSVEDKIARIEYSMKITDDARTFLSRTLPDVMLKRAADYISQQANLYLGSLFPSISITVSPDFDILVENSNGSAVYDGLSGGERRATNLALALAMKDFHTLWHERTIGFGVYDEPFDGLDDEIATKFVDVLRRRTNEQVLVVSHAPNVQDMFYERILVEKGDNGSCACIVYG